MLEIISNFYVTIVSKYHDFNFNKKHIRKSSALTTHALIQVLVKTSEMIYRIRVLH